MAAVSPLVAAACSCVSNGSSFNAIVRCWSIKLGKSPAGGVYTGSAVGANSTGAVGAVLGASGSMAVGKGSASTTGTISAGMGVGSGGLASSAKTAA